MPCQLRAGGSRRIPRGVWVLVLVAFALRLTYCAYTNGLGHTVFGHREYIITAARLLDHGTMASPLVLDSSEYEPSRLMPPGYVAVVAAVFRTLGTETLAAFFVLQLINATATSAVVAFVFALARRFGGNTAGWIAAALVTVNPVLLGYTNHIWDASIFTLGIVLCLWITLRLGDRPTTPARWLGFGMLLGALALLNPAFTAAYPFLVLWPLTRQHGWKLRPLLLGVAMTLCGWLLAIGPWTIRNYVHFGELGYVRGGLMMDVWLGVCPEADTEGMAVFANRFPLMNADEQRKVSLMGEEAYIDECGRRATAAINADPQRFLRLIALRVIDYWMGTVFSHAEETQKNGWPRHPRRAAVMLFLAAEALAIVACLILRRSAISDLWWLLAMLAVFSIIYCLTHMLLRFRAPTEPILAIVLGSLASRSVFFNRRPTTSER